ncbi:uncharacterized protein MYCFIDRAFT_212089 [Pseudocercospora fijiensis CIRAD86]|uniref:Extracellular membrane protein CFEM domain-containing protein n=1 Tax=Pseudocercospora fijiensis (strain CIRAD86) TaxID=383855 RepID=M2ZND9_PSEFD|nr:uncharacterized protein MYCFIDRAFT_212089 [Pseudocercospora fijiensis CIRAD86]EME80614.1 hypothetical protein MYCFIDRAFT_212089 [Pseudocercospora fijiensis CIRAD86]
MKQTIAATALLSGLAAAVPQWGGHGGPNNGGSWGAGGPFAGFPSCVSSCRDSNADYSNYKSLCTNNDMLNTLNTCVDDSSCSDSEKSDVKETIAQLCANSGATITAAPFASYSVTSGGSAWPTAWTTNSAWASAVSAWNGNGNGRPGWGGPGAGGFGPFGQHGGPGGNGWGAGPWASSGAWTSGAWTSWWGTKACPASTWSGWTDASWSTSAPWTTWSACTAQTTATTTVTVTTTDSSGSSITSISTSFGIRVAEATSDSNDNDNDNGNAASSTNSDSGAMPTNRAVFGAAAGVFGVVAGALVL